jgi:hypothetical protein
MKLIDGKASPEFIRRTAMATSVVNDLASAFEVDAPHIIWAIGAAPEITEHDPVCAYYQSGNIVLWEGNDESEDEAILLHEFAHHLVRDEYPDHGFAFFGALVSVVGVRFKGDLWRYDWKAQESGSGVLEMFNDLELAEKGESK